MNKWHAQLDAEKDFRQKQFAVAEFRPEDLNELGLMAAAAAMYDKTNPVTDVEGVDTLTHRRRYLSNQSACKERSAPAYQGPLSASSSKDACLRSSQDFSCWVQATFPVTAKIQNSPALGQGQEPRASRNGAGDGHVLLTTTVWI